MATPNIEQQIYSLRAELKEWEKSFSEVNGGRKPAREDIKKDPTIATKYKIYSRLRVQASSASVVKGDNSHPTFDPDDRKQSQKKRPYPFTNTTDKHDTHTFTTPHKIAKYTPPSTENNGIYNAHPSQLDPYESPSNIKNRLLSPRDLDLSLRVAIGPTPQRDGKVLGLFDLLPVSGQSIATPSRRKKLTLVDDVPTPSRAKELVTPSGREGSTVRRRRHSLTPASSAKKFYLSNFFATPTTMRYGTIVETDKGEEDGIVLQAQHDLVEKKQGSELETPAFLRRRNVLFSRPVNGSESKIEGKSPVAVRMPQKVIGKGLSQLVQGLRDLEEEAMQDDMDALREAEAAEVEAEQGFPEDDQAAENNWSNRTQTDSPSKIQRQWKKKGQKRTTKLVRIRPVRRKPQRAREPTIAEEESEDELTTLTESQIPNSAERNEDSKNANDKRTETSNRAEKEKQGGSKLVQKARKLKAAAHANYRALKIRSKNGKGKGRFGRRR
ncbi:hypothetical protein PRK78_005615 [Emydomyces testavorans]|uniref:DNA replication regulator SLD2 n=1 Tax=Emydomyces testavorans TaxID=2070801 RepID=A0AAF0IJP4_9EURO|nr:hypothetical protein PRK78_005615 [Emydomyces testavorans]